MLNKICIVSFLVGALTTSPVICQSIDHDNFRRKISGSIVDAQNGESVPYALVQISRTAKGAVANEKGEFTLWVNHDDSISSVTVSSLGYQSKEVALSNNILKISLSPAIAYLKQVEVYGQKTFPKEILKQLVEGYQNQLQSQKYQLEAYYYSIWVNEQSQDTAINEAVYTLLYDSYYEENKYPAGAVLQKRRVNDKVSLIPWPQHAYVASDFRPDIGLLNKKLMKAAIVDSIRAIGHEASIFYHVDDPRGRGTGWSDVESYRGIMVYDETTMRLISHQKLMNFNNSGKRKGFINASYFVKYELSEGLNLGVYCQLAYSAISEKGIVSGVDITRINTVKRSDFDFPEHPIFKIEEAPYDPAFWEHYNRIK